MMRLKSCAPLAAIALALAGCGDGGGGQVTPPTQTRITLNTTSASVVENDSVRLTWTLTGFQTAPAVTLGSSDAGVAGVAASGWVTGIAPGTARIIARAGDVADTADIRVTQRAVSLAFSGLPDSVSAGSGPVALQAKVSDIRGDGVAAIAVRLTPLYPAGQQSTVTTGTDGTASFELAAPTAAGAYLLEASVTQPAGIAPDTATLVVTGADATAIVIEGEDPLALQVGDTARLGTSFTDAFGNPAAAMPITWVSSDELVAVVDAGLVEATGEGIASILAVSGVLRDSVRAVVTLPPPSNATIAPPSASFTALLDTIQFSLTLTTPQGDTVAGQPVTWSVLDDAIASVDANGRVVALAPGATRVVGTSGALSDTADVSVVQVPASVTLSPASVTLDAVGETTQLSAGVADANGQAIAGAALTWSSLNTGVVSIDATGLVTATGNGSTSIVAVAGAAADTISVTVQQVAASVEISPPAATLNALGATAQLVAAVRDAGGQPVSGAPLTWSSLDEAVASVDGNGLVTAIANGAANVVVQTGALADTAVVTVAQAAAAMTITLPVDTMRLEGETQQLSVAYVDANGTTVPGITTSWTSSAASIAAVDASGLVTAGAVNGTAWIRASGGAITDSVRVVVRDVAIVLYTAANSDTVFNVQVAMFAGAPAVAYIYSETGALLATRTGPTISYTFPAALDGTVKRVDIKADRTQVQAIEAAEDNLVGTLPDGILDLPNLAVINLAINPGLTGAIPDGIGLLTNLAAIELFSTSLSGPLPASFGNLTGLDILNLSDTQLSGSVAVLELLPTLWYLDLGGTNFTGAMPALGNYNDLVELYIDASGLNAYTGGLDQLVLVTIVDFSDANLPAGDVDRVLTDLLTSVTAVPRGGSVDLGGANAAPGPTGQAAAAALVNAGWSVVVAP